MLIGSNNNHQSKSSQVLSSSFSCIMDILACFLLILTPYAASISFNLTTINPNHKDMFILEGESYISEDAIQVTPENTTSSVTAHVTYTEPLHLWDRSSGGLASFSTSFSFVKLSDPKEIYRQDDGFIFFLAKNSSVTTGNDGAADQYVWVEFDPYCNGWDTSPTSCDHVGINLNSKSSVKQQVWHNDVSSGRECHVWIKYDSVSKNLSVSFTGFRDDKVEIDGVAYTVDLRKELPEWVVFGFSATAGELSDKNTVKSWMFNSYSFQFDESESPQSKLGFVVGLAAGVAVLITLLVTLAYVLRRKKKNNSDKVEEVEISMEMNDEFDMGATWPRKFSYFELARATADFAEKEKLGEGSFGGVYKGFLKDLRAYVAVKRVSKNSHQGIKEYASEVRIISRLRHRNLVQLTGWCHEKGELLLVYEYMENGSLDSHLFKAKSMLTWGTRYQIAIGLASALLYLHEE